MMHSSDTFVNLQMEHKYRHTSLWTVLLVQMRMTPMTGNLTTLVTANLGMSQVIHNDYVICCYTVYHPCMYHYVCIKFCKMTLKIIGVDNYTSVHTCTHTHTHMHTHTHAHTHTHTHTHARAHIHTHTHTHMLYACIHTCITRTNTPF